MLRDEWDKVAAFVLLIVIGCATGYLATLPTRALTPGVWQQAAAVAQKPSKPEPAAPSPHQAVASTQAPTVAGAPSAPETATPPAWAVATPPVSSEAIPAPDAGTSQSPSVQTAETVAPSADTPTPQAPTVKATEPATQNPSPATVASLPPEPVAAAPGERAPLDLSRRAPAPAPPPDPIAALKAAAAAGDLHAQYALALAFKLGRGVPSDTNQSMNWMRKAAEAGLGVAQRSLGITYEEGAGVDKDETQAARWYANAAASGDIQAMHNLAYFYTQGLGGLEKDGQKAEHLFRTAAERGLLASQINLAILLSQGDQWGLQTRLAEAYFWSGVAARRSDPQAVRMHAVFATLISKSDKTDEDAKIKSFRAKPTDAATNGGFDIAPEAFVRGGTRAALSETELSGVRDMLKALGYGAADTSPSRKLALKDGGANASDAAPAGNDADLTPAIKAFQAEYGLKATGKADRELLAALKAVPR